MPTENRSSNTEMVSVPEGYMLVERNFWTEAQVEAATKSVARLRSVRTMSDRDLAMAAMDAAQCTAPDISLSDLLPADQRQGEPVAWMREDGRDAWTAEKKSDAIAHNGTPGAAIAAKYTQPLYTHADPAEVERIKAELVESDHAFVRMASEAEKLRAQLEERDALLDRLRDHLIANGVLGEFGPELFQILNIEAPERASLVKP
ncbi:hypothetical protein [Pseudomonas putida]|uniref:hypothetical protein n=1 Tax=Pseudomonas putida TaxID=303 RepID=UPI001E34FAB6|nr:hypothetical protein [Pseudomonas putida]MCE0958738.1 hypothetical protein [Pseudomonas putida]